MMIQDLLSNVKNQFSTKKANSASLRKKMNKIKKIVICLCKTRIWFSELHCVKLYQRSLNTCSYSEKDLRKLLVFQIFHPFQKFSKLELKSSFYTNKFGFFWPKKNFSTELAFMKLMYLNFFHAPAFIR